MLRVVMLAVVTALIAGMLKKTQPTLTWLLTIGAGTYIVLFAVSSLRAVFVSASILYENLEGGTAYLQVLLKITGLAYLGEYGSALCRDAGCQALAEQVAMAARCSILVVSFPVVIQLVEVMEKLV